MANKEFLDKDGLQHYHNKIKEYIDNHGGNVPTKLSELTNDVGYITSAFKNAFEDKETETMLNITSVGFTNEHPTGKTSGLYAIPEDKFIYMNLKDSNELKPSSQSITGYYGDNVIQFTSGVILHIDTTWYDESFNISTSVENNKYCLCYVNVYSAPGDTVFIQPLMRASSATFINGELICDTYECCSSETIPNTPYFTYNYFASINDINNKANISYISNETGLESKFINLMTNRYSSGNKIGEFVSTAPFDIVVFETDVTFNTIRN